MINEPLQAGDFVEILPVMERPAGQPAVARRYGYVVEAADEDSRVAIQVQDRRYPLRVPLRQLYRLGDRSPSTTECSAAAAGGGRPAPLTVRGARYGVGSTQYSGH
jgi:hypothetical protein